MQYRLSPVVLVIFLASLRCFASANNERSQCSFVSQKKCFQYWAARSRNLTCEVGQTFTACEQLCNTGRCNGTCKAPDLCNQHCIAGACNFPVCDSKRCNQRCLRSGCKLRCQGDQCVQRCDVGGCEMTCAPGVKRCVQSCSGGKCKMSCPAGVERCEQSCSSGQCLMTCNATDCKRSCRRSKCVYDKRPVIRKVPRLLDTCNHLQAQGMCYQQCREGNCAIVSIANSSLFSFSQACHGSNCSHICNAQAKCSQVCNGGDCKQMLCNSQVCIQECAAGGCNMECNSKLCLQICRGGNCKMECKSHDVHKCRQLCTGGGCLLVCNAETCNPRCYGGNCRYVRLRPPGSGISEICNSVEGGVCTQVCASNEGCSLTCNPEKGLQTCNQTCDDGFCLLNCSTKADCNQNCAGSQCHVMTCDANTCTQVCNGGECGVMECKAERCTQMCLGFGCHMKCHPSVQSCSQVCNAGLGQCVFECHGKNCVTTLL